MTFFLNMFVVMSHDSYNSCQCVSVSDTFSSFMLYQRSFHILSSCFVVFVFLLFYSQLHNNLVLGI